MSDYPKFQVSKFLDDKRQYQAVVRAETFEELKESMDKLKPWMKALEQKPEVKDVMEDQLPESIPCPTHGDKMYLRDGKYGPYYSHKHGEEWCNLDAKKFLKNRDQFEKELEQAMGR